MTAIRRASLFALTTLLVTAGCSSENPPATSNAGNGGQGGSSAGNGGSSAGTGGGTSGSAGTSTAGTAGASGSGGTGGSGTTGSGGGAGTTGTTDFTPACGSTATGTEIAKGVACAAADVQLCWKKCGPQSSGWKSETCTGGIYAEGDCQFPAGADYSCFKIPTTLHADCPTDAAMMPQASQDCAVPECNACSVGGQYKTSTAEIKVGWCVCQPPNSAGKRSWTCASGTAWPCPLGQGC